MAERLGVRRGRVGSLGADLFHPHDSLCEVPRILCLGCDPFVSIPTSP